MKTFGLIGKNIDYSFSRNYFQQKFQKENINNCEYINFDIQNISEVESVFKKMNSGYNVTIPYKEIIIPFLDKLDNHAKTIGAVNTIKIHKNGTLKGFNTDYIGFIESLKPHLKPYHTKALVLGTGGASKAIVYGLTLLNIESIVVSRTPKGNEISYEDVNENVFKEIFLIINTTPIGTFPNINEAPKIPYSYFTEKHIAYDLIYNPNETKFLQNAKNNKAFTINGLQMLILQAEAAWQIWNK